ncbi:unnamed protein product [Lepeophtheirus salmonis]|uniref:(salmon louse) hypothetical protein n=1 Tax=Lepeophtheirus salmonis TaxID=72036 RepID=A0A7R8CU31_LEPSM|nr:unnamed protein product [Lepeophtheirus salmonis]CAF2931842.1 unnamed protein product [Lepeophtheirus salmonis]
MNPRALYKFLIRETLKLPTETRSYYIRNIRNGFFQHADEPDPERVKQIISRALEDAEWETLNERKYILDQTRSLFRANKDVSDPVEINRYILEAEARLTMAEHYRNPYPRPVNYPKGMYTKKVGKSHGKAMIKKSQQSRPAYMKSLDTK